MSNIVQNTRRVIQLLSYYLLCDVQY